ncbi:MAG TPA: AAA family ATPase [Hyphomicrobium sp.]|nr:AAA family ATPase [Hyphomicrobium sp.]
MNRHSDSWVDTLSNADLDAITLRHDRRWITARELDEMEFEAVKYVVPGYIAEGLTLLAGKPKLGKSWLAMDIALTVASGGICLGDVECEKGDVLYLALEDNKRRLQSRIRSLWSYDRPTPDRLHLATEWPRADKDGIRAIREWIENHPGARLVIIDVLAMFKATTKGRDQTQYDADFAAIKSLQSLAMETCVAIVVIHHTRKGGGDADPFEKVSGTLGLSGAADTTIILDRDQNGCTLYGRGRDIEEFETAVEFDKSLCRWRALGDATEVRRTDERGTILTVLTDASEPMNPREIAIEADMKRNNVDKLLGKMVKCGEVIKAKRGLYIHPSRSDLLTDDDLPTPGQNGQKIRNTGGWGNA